MISAVSGTVSVISSSVHPFISSSVHPAVCSNDGHVYVPPLLSVFLCIYLLSVCIVLYSSIAGQHVTVTLFISAFIVVCLTESHRRITR